jgi:hypothetical protein
MPRTQLRIQRPLAPIVVVYTVVDKKITKKAFSTADAFLRENRSGTVAAGGRDGKCADAGASRGAAREGGRRRETRRGFFP